MSLLTSCESFPSFWISSFSHLIALVETPEDLDCLRYSTRVGQNSPTYNNSWLLQHRECRNNSVKAARTSFATPRWRKTLIICWWYVELTPHSKFESGEFSDLVIKCENREWKVHRIVVCCHIPFLEKACKDGAFKVCCSQFPSWAFFWCPRLH